MSRRPLDFQSIEEVIAELDRLQAGGYQKGGNWRLAEACNHLGTFVRGSLEGFRGARPHLLLRWIGPFVLRRILKKRRMPEGIRTPAQFEPRSVTDDGREVESLKELLRRFATHRGPLHPSPLAGELSYDTWRDLHLVHCAHHLSFLHPTAGA
jgi:hypothetical protein